MNLKTLLASLFMLSPACIFPVIPEVEVWSNGTNYRYLLKDWHRDYVDGRISIKQQADILWTVQQLDANDVFVIVEDSMSYYGDNQKIQDILTRNPATIQDYIARAQARENIEPTTVVGSSEIFADGASPLAYLANSCEIHGIQHCNVECSQAISLYQVNLITRQEVIAELAEIIADLARCVLFRPSTNLFMQKLAELQKMAPRPYSLLRVHLATEQEFVDKAIALRWLLVDLKTIDQVIEWNNIKHGFICEGELHFKSIKPILTELGYKHVCSIGNAAVWDQPIDYSEKQLAEKDKQMLQSALDLRATFKQIFEKQATLNRWNIATLYTLGRKLLGFITKSNDSA